MHARSRSAELCGMVVDNEPPSNLEVEYPQDMDPMHAASPVRWRTTTVATTAAAYATSAPTTTAAVTTIDDANVTDANFTTFPAIPNVTTVPTTPVFLSSTTFATTLVTVAPIVKSSSARRRSGDGVVSRRRSAGSYSSYGSIASAYLDCYLPTPPPTNQWFKVTWLIHQFVN